MLLGLGDRDAQDTILEASRDAVLVNPRGEAERAGKLANAALGEPVLGVVHGRAGVGARVAHNLEAILLLDAGVVLISHGGLVRSGRGGGLLDRCGSGRRLLDSSGSVGGAAGGVCPLDLAADDEGLGLGELDAHVALVEAGQLAVELIGVGRLADVESGLPVGSGRSAEERRLLLLLSLLLLLLLLLGLAAAGARVALARVRVKVVKKTEERRKGSLVVVDGAGEKGGHFVGVVMVVSWDSARDSKVHISQERKEEEEAVVVACLCCECVCDEEKRIASSRETSRFFIGKEERMLL